MIDAEQTAQPLAAFHCTDYLVSRRRARRVTASLQCHHRRPVSYQHLRPGCRAAPADEQQLALGHLCAAPNSRQRIANVPRDAALNARDAARGDASDDYESDAHLVEEANWQMKALDLINKTAPAYAETWFKEIDTEPKWLEDYRDEWVTG